MIKYLIEGFRWFDSFGNTYHTILITDLNDNKIIFSSETEVYGYDDCYRQTAYDELIKLNLVKKEDRHNHDLNRKRFIYRVTDVKRKKDLF